MKKEPTDWKRKYTQSIAAVAEMSLPYGKNADWRKVTMQATQLNWQGLVEQLIVYQMVLEFRLRLTKDAHSKLKLWNEYSD